MRLTQRKGDVAVSQAISSFTKLGYDVSIPLTESAHYDLVIDSAEGLKRVQVKYTSKKDVDLRRVHSNSSGYVVKKAQENAYDWLYVYKESGEEYLFLVCLFGRRAVRPFDKDLLRNVLKRREETE
ncbi:hypothetical protein A3A75_03160 [Candidatus Woesebacteria bacterium RIFCSPLOWO2_01_FULL_39_10]|uniref:PD(D/E)XK endonuclease domain-containing protein n=1 Tax=Candidatus Woesebacteria bacterium RIFCSPLOWO2_01_FULL_39_10 TaxID=1802516 RepID=A0A1F8B5B8_9BACT|nr:MAG: hypothetical protein A3A75_03160 [Candidatus Woesebacteria bacterium RIFCSPLOWO2_01_FULL_39_10]